MAKGKKKPAQRKTAFEEVGLKESVEFLLEEIRELYRCDAVPWVIGYSGGKDSTAVLQLVWMAVASLPLEERFKAVHVISTDTLVENPIVASWVTRSLEVMKEAAEAQQMPVEPHRLTPEVTDSFWVNLIGKGYPAPRHKFRWCTERLKIKPSNKFISEMVRRSGEAILVLGTRKAESTKRAGRMTKLEAKRLRERLSPNASLPNSLVYTPIENWSNDDVWLFLMQYKNPWGYRNKDLLTMYQGASADGECPLVVDTSTPSCGDSRFGCWVCTLVDKDRSMSAMIQNDAEKEWMLPLLEFRDALDVADDRHLRDFRRIYGRVEVMGTDKRHIPGPYKQKVREQWLRRLLEAQKWIRENGADEVRNIELVTLDELQEISRVWVVDKHEIEDSLPQIWEEVMGEAYPGAPLDETPVFGSEEMSLLRDACGGDELHFELLRELLDVERRFRTSSRRAGLFEALEKAFSRSGFGSAEEAIEEARKRHDALSAAERGDLKQLQLLFTPQDGAGSGSMVSDETGRPA